MIQLKAWSSQITRSQALQSYPIDLRDFVDEFPGIFQPAIFHDLQCPRRDNRLYLTHVMMKKLRRDDHILHFYDSLCFAGDVKHHKLLHSSRANIIHEAIHYLSPPKSFVGFDSNWVISRANICRDKLWICLSSRHLNLMTSWAERSRWKRS